jgi:hypothetical protein
LCQAVRDQRATAARQEWSALILSGKTHSVISVNAVIPRLDAVQGGYDRFLGEDVGEGERSLLKELPPEKTDLLPEPSVTKIVHR